MLVVKKYPNRKLYDTREKRYITLETLAEHIQAGEQVQVIDNDQGTDITAAVLVQVIVQSYEQRQVPLSTTILTDIIRLGGDALQRLGALGSEFTAAATQPATRADVQDLHQRLDNLAAAIDQLDPPDQPAPPTRH